MDIFNDKERRSKAIIRYLSNNNVSQEVFDLLMILAKPKDVLIWLNGHELTDYNLEETHIGYNLPRYISSSHLESLMRYVPPIIIKQHFATRNPYVDRNIINLLLDGDNPMEWGFQDAAAILRRDRCPHSNTYIDLMRCIKVKQSILNKWLDDPVMNSPIIEPKEYIDRESNALQRDTGIDIEHLQGELFNRIKRFIDLGFNNLYAIILIILPTYMSLDDILMSNIFAAQPDSSSDALNILKKEVSHDKIYLSLLCMVMNRSDTIEAIKLLKSNTPSICGYKLRTEDIGVLINNNVNLDVVEAYLINDKLPNHRLIEYILSKENEFIYRETVYYYAMSRMHITMMFSPSLRTTDTISEVKVLEDIPSRYSRCKSRLNAIYQIRDNTGTSSGICNNDDDLLGNDISDIPPFLIYGLNTGNTSYCLSSSDMYQLVKNNRYSNPYTNEILTQESIDNIHHALRRLLASNYPIALCIYEDFTAELHKEPIPTNITDMDHSMRIDLWNKYKLPPSAMKDMVAMSYGHSILDAIRSSYQNIYNLIIQNQ